MIYCWLGVLIIIGIMSVTSISIVMIFSLVVTVLSALICTDLYRKGV